MRGLKRNEQAITYRPYLKTVEQRNAQGNLTGGKIRTYGEHIPITGSVSAAGSWVSQRIFGTSLDYDYTILSHESDLGVKEDDLIYIGGKSCVIRKIAPSLNVTAIAVRQVAIDGA